VTYVPHTNGQHVSVKAELQETRRKIRLVEAELRLLALEQVKSRQEFRKTGRRDLIESVGDTFWDSWVNPYSDLLDRLTSDGRLFCPISIANDRLYGANWPFWRTWVDHALLRGAARLICTTSNQAQGVLGGLASFVIGEGFTFKARAIEGRDPPDGMIDACQKTINEFHKRNRMARRQREWFIKCRRDGEFFARTFPHKDHDWLTTCRNVDATQIVEPPGVDYKISSFGCLNELDDLEDIYAYWVSYNGNNSEGEEVSADEMVHYKINVDSEVKRGLTDFCFDTYDSIKAVGRLLENMLEGSAVQAAIAMIIQHEGALQSEAQAFDDSIASYQVPGIPSTAGLNQQQNTKMVTPGTVYQTPKNMTFAAAPYSQGLSLHTAVATQACQMVGSKWNAPTWLISGDSGSSSYAASLTAESPFVKRCKSEQQMIGDDGFKPLYWQAIKRKCDAGRMIDPDTGQRYSWDDVKNEIDLDFTPPTVETRNKLEEANRHNIELQAKVTSRQLWAAEIGNDWEQVQQDNEEFDERQGGQQGQQLPLPGDQEGQLPGDQEAEQEQGLSAPAQQGNPDEGEPYTEGLLEGFTGIDSHHHHWVDGKQVKANPGAVGASDQHKAIVAGVYKERGYHTSEFDIRNRLAERGVIDKGHQDAAIKETPIPKPLTGVEEASDFIGKEIEPSVLAAMANSLEGTNIQVSRIDYGGARKLHIIARGQGVSSQRTLSRDENGKLVMHNDSFGIDDKSSHKGKGFEFFKNQVDALMKAGVDRIETDAEGNANDPEFNGYYTWPRLGYDGTITRRTFAKLPQEFQEKMGDSRSVLDLMDLPGGKEVWKKHGNRIYNASFDLTPGSRNHKVLAAYIEERRARNANK
jgi:hypothetical protein